MDDHYGNFNDQLYGGPSSSTATNYMEEDLLRDLNYNDASYFQKYNNIQPGSSTSEFVYDQLSSWGNPISSPYLPPSGSYSSLDSNNYVFISPNPYNPSVHRSYSQSIVKQSTSISPILSALRSDEAQKNWTEDQRLAHICGRVIKSLIHEEKNLDMRLFGGYCIQLKEDLDELIRLSKYECAI